MDPLVSVVHPRFLRKCPARFICSFHDLVAHVSHGCVPNCLTKLSQAKVREAKALKQNKLVGRAAALKARAHRAQQLDAGAEAFARRFTEDEREREVELAYQAALSGGGTSSRGAALHTGLTDVPAGMQVLIHAGAAARTAVLAYEDVLTRAAIEYTPDALMCMCDADLHALHFTHRQEDHLIDHVLHNEHWTQQQRAAARADVLHGAAVLMCARGCSVACLAWGSASRGGSMQVLIVHTHLAWRRRQYAELLWHQLRARLPVGGRVVLEAACCQAGPAGRFWTRLGFTGTSDVQRGEKRALSGQHKGVEAGTYQMSWQRKQ